MHAATYLRLERRRPTALARDTVHLFLDLPRGIDKSRLTALIADLKGVKSVRVD